MALSANSLVGLTHAARVALESGRGEGYAQMQRIVAAIGSERPDVLANLMRGAKMDAMEVASLVRDGWLVVLDTTMPTHCERCHRTPTRGTSLCTPCRHYLGWARLLGEEVPDAPPVLRGPAVALPGSAMHTRGDP